MNYILLGIEDAQKGSFLMAVPLRPYTPPPLELKCSQNFVNKLWKNAPTKLIFIIMASALPLPPPSLNDTAIKKITFFAAALTNIQKLFFVLNIKSMATELDCNT